MDRNTLKALAAMSAAMSLSMTLAGAAGAHVPRAHHRAHVHALARGTGSGDPQLRSASALVVDQTDSSVLLAKNPDVASPIASITKLMTALVVLEAGQSLAEPIQVTEPADDFGKTKYSRLAVGTTLTRGDMMHLALMASENRAANSLGSHYPGGLPAIVRAMNAKAAALGMTSAHFVEPTGLSSENVASAADLAKLVVAASKNPTIREYSTDPSYAVRVRRHIVEFRNTDKLVSNPSWNIVVQKTGYITEAGRCLVMEAIIEGRSVVIVLLDSFGKYTRLADATRVRHWLESAAASPRLTRVSMR
jgi:D-alanyl-D-alanine endopeptidase (penicillin-binding protein 7)